MEKPNYYAIIPASVRYDKELRANEKLLYGEITALCGASGYCWGSNRYFADLYGVSTRIITTWIKHLEDKGYISTTVIYKEGTKEVLERRIYIVPVGIRAEDPPEQMFYTPRTNVQDPPRTNVPDPPEQKFQENNTRVNITSMNNIMGPAPEKKQKKFVKPTVEEIGAYCKERNNRIDPQKFFDYYESNGWKVGKNPMKDWKAAVRTWERNGYSDSGTKTDRTYGSNKPEGFDFFNF